MNSFEKSFELGVRIILLFQNGHLKVRNLEEKDDHLLARWLSNPSVLEFYEGRDNPFDLKKVTKVFYNSSDQKFKCIVEYDSNEIGYLQFYQLDDETKAKYGYGDENIYGADQFIGENEYWNRGIGTTLVTSLVSFLIAHKKADRVVMDPQIRNVRAIKCYEKSGFKKVKILVKNELHEGVYQDCWLIEYQKRWKIPEGDSRKFEG